MALFAEEISFGVLPADNPDGPQAGTILSMVHKAEGRRKATAFADHLRQVWLRKDALHPQQLVAPPSLSLEVLARGRGVLVVDKPDGIMTEEVLESVSQDLGLPLSTTSRLDQPTSGILPIALGSEAAAATNWLRAQWAGRLVSKSYVCLCAGRALEVGFASEVKSPLRAIPGDNRQQEVSAAGKPARSPLPQVSVLAWESRPAPLLLSLSICVSLYTNTLCILYIVYKRICHSHQDIWDGAAASMGRRGHKSRAFL